MRFLYILLLMPFLSACDMPFQTRSEIEEQKQGKESQKQVVAIQQAEKQSRLDDMDSDLRALGGRVETLEYNQRNSQQGNNQETQNLKAQVTQLDGRLKALEQHVDATEQRLIAAIQAIGKTESPSKSDDESAKPKNSTYSEADEYFEEKDHKRAIVKFQEYLDKNPKGKYAAEATYKIGLCFKELKDKKTATEFFKETVEKFPGTPSAKKAQQRLKGK